MTSLIQVPVPEAAPILAIDEGDQKWVAIRPVCDQLGIDTQAQHRKLDQAEWATIAMKAVVAADGKLRDMVMLDADHLPMWLGTIQASRVNEGARPTLIAYQREAARALRDYFYRGVAVATELSQFDILRAAIDRLEESERVANEAKAIAERSEARLDGIEGKHDWFSALGYARLNGLPTYEKFLRKLGKCASMIARTHDIAPDKAQHAHYGTVNSYPEWIWKLAADGLAES